MTRISKFFIISACGAILAACSNDLYNKFLGGQRDDHGCLSAAGYTWSDVLHQCVRVWEIADRLEQGSRTAFVLFSADSARAEIFTTDGSVICMRDKVETNKWNEKRGQSKLTIQNGVMTVRTSGVTYTKELHN